MGLSSFLEFAAVHRQKEEEKSLQLRAQALNAQLIEARAKVADLKAAAQATPATTASAMNTTDSATIHGANVKNRRHEPRHVTTLGQGLKPSTAAAASLLLTLAGAAGRSKQWRCFEWFRRVTNSNSGSLSSSRGHHEWPLSLCWPDSSSSHSSTSPSASSFTFLLLPRSLVILCAVLAVWAAVLAAESSGNSSSKNSSSSGDSNSGRSRFWYPFIRTTAGSRDALAAHASLLLVTYMVGLAAACISGAGAIGGNSSSGCSNGGSGIGLSLPLCRRRRLLQLTAVGLSAWLAAAVESGNAATRALANAVSFRNRDGSRSGGLPSQDGPATEFFGAGGGVAMGSDNHGYNGTNDGDAREEEWAAAVRWILLALGVLVAILMEPKLLPPLPLSPQEISTRSYNFIRGESDGMGITGGRGLEGVKEGGDSRSDSEGSSNSSSCSGIGVSALSFDSASSGSSAPLRFRRASSINEGHDDGRPIGGSFDRNV